MQPRVKNELSLLLFLAALVAATKNKPKASLTCALTGVALRLLPQSKEFNFAGKAVIITGGSRGLGLALAKQLAHEGALLTLLARDPNELARAKALLTPIADVDALVCDVTDPAALQKIFAAVNDKHGHIDVLINNAGAISVGPLAAQDAFDFAASMNIHFWAVFHAIQAARPYLRKSGGRIVNIASIAAKFPHPHMAPYIASKSAQSGLSKAIRGELAQENIGLTSVYPGLMRTGSYIQAVFQGDHEREFDWFATSDLIPGLSMSAESAAKKILRSARDGDSELVLSVPAKLGALVYSLFPGICDSLLAIYAKTLPAGVSHERKTGAQSQSDFLSKSWNKPLRELGDKAKALYNQTEKVDAEFNLGIGSKDHLH